MNKQFRQAQLRALLDGPIYAGNRARLIAHSGLTHGRISQLLDEDSDEPFGERAARNLCDALARHIRIRPDYFEAPEKRDDSLTPLALDIAQRLDAIRDRDAYLLMHKRLLAAFDEALPDVDSSPPPASVDEHMAAIKTTSRRLRQQRATAQFHGINKKKG